MRPPKPLSMPGSAVATPPPPYGAEHKGPRPLNLPAAATHTPAPSRAMETSKVDQLLARAIGGDPTLEQSRFRLKPRFDTLLISNDDDILDWGERNLQALGGVANEKSRLSARLDQINPTDWINRAMEASSKPPSLMGKLFGSVESPAYFETRLQQIRSELLDMRKKLSEQREEIAPDADDLRMDIVALQVFFDSFPDKFDSIIVHSRLRTLTTAQQSVVVALAAIDQFRQVCVTSISSIDQLLTSVVPNWKLAESRR